MLHVTDNTSVVSVVQENLEDTVTNSDGFGVTPRKHVDLDLDPVRAGSLVKIDGSRRGEEQNFVDFSSRDSLALRRTLACGDRAQDNESSGTHQ